MHYIDHNPGSWVGKGKKSSTLKLGHLPTARVQMGTHHPLHGVRTKLCVTFTESRSVATFFKFTLICQLYLLSLYCPLCPQPCGPLHGQHRRPREEQFGLAKTSPGAFTICIVDIYCSPRDSIPFLLSCLSILYIVPSIISF